ncbi:glutathione S-transferase N-terminal domain-containing protein [Hyphococcus sp.]|uniref:glutathione S-transferase N-terminal domain-containing protein n=1 Tax=Hyphococcus sp. TaxID=2038636 RepID=UPI00207F139A|nr:MAG: glutathione S-transferase [Marinicaulis sp.]
MRTLYEIGLADSDIRPSPYCWIAKFALLHKGLAFETALVGFSAKQNYPDPDYGKVPVLIDGGEMIRDSAAIMDYLDAKYASRPLCDGASTLSAASFFSAWAGAALYPALGPMSMQPLFAAASAADQAYISETFTARTGMKVDDYAAGPDAEKKVEAALHLLATPLATHPFLGGGAPNRSDYVVFAPLMWARVASAEELYVAPQPVASWIERMLDLYDGYARKAKRIA